MDTFIQQRVRLGDLLVEKKIITEQQLQNILHIHKSSGRKLGQLLIEKGYITENALLSLLATQLKITFIDLKKYPINPDTVQLIPEIYARRFRAIALEENATSILVGMIDPTDIFAFDELSRILKRPLSLAVVRESDLLEILDTIYRRTAEISNLAEQLGDEIESQRFDLRQIDDNNTVQDAPVVKLLQSIFEDAMQMQASDIHIEPDEQQLRIRQRVDNILHEHSIPDNRIATALALRLKLMAKLDISEKRLPQDGRFSVIVKNHAIDVRISTLPVQYGESVVLRILDASRGLLALPDLGMSKNAYAQTLALLKQPYGMVLVTAPTGNGKTTTLYASLQELNQAEVKIISIEDPIEYRLPRINQVQINAEIGLNFSHVLRASLRQDPDVILIGEMRDEETVEIGLRAAITGHLVLSTLHTQNAISTLSRLLDMGAKPYLIAAALRAVIAQRLVRKICRYCREIYQPSPQEKASFHLLSSSHSLEEKTLYHGIGCAHCHHTGYQGSIGIFEILVLDEKLVHSLLNHNMILFAELSQKQLAGCSLRDSLIELVLSGITSLSEAQRIARGLDNIFNDTLVYSEDKEG